MIEETAEEGKNRRIREREGSVERVRQKGVSKRKVVEKKLIYNFQ